MNGNQEQERRLSIPDALSLAVDLHRNGRGEEAEGIYRDILRKVPGQPDALNFLGVLRYQQGKMREAVDLIRQAIAAKPDHPDAHNNLGNVLHAQGDLEEAEAAFRRSIALNPENAGPRNNLGLVLKAQGRVDEAFLAFRESIAADPDRADAHYNLGNLLHSTGHSEEAIASYRKALSIAPAYASALRALATSYYMTDRNAEAIAVYHQLLAHDPEDPSAHHMLAAITGEQVPARASDRYVRSTFDGMAKSFDIQLANLDYQGPALVEAALRDVLDQPRANLDVLDAGCGTGLAGSLLRPYARRLVGVDLSPGMLARARDRGDYDELVEAELSGFLEGQYAAFDLIVSSDTLVYFGALEEFANGAAQALRSGGCLVCTLERSLGDAAREDYRLHPHGRYSHRREYLAAVLPAAGLSGIRIEEVMLRKECGHPVAGWRVIAWKA